MSEIRETIQLPTDKLAMRLYGPGDQNLKIIEETLDAKIIARGHEMTFIGKQEDVAQGTALIRHLATLASDRDVRESDVHYALSRYNKKQPTPSMDGLNEVLLVTNRGKQIRPKTLGQKAYLQLIREKTITFGIGPAGTGKTYLAVVMAVRALKRREVERIILTRPAVEAGEKLGFLPGDLQEKIDPYLRPLYDGLYDTLGKEVASRYLEKGIIELAPLAYMRGRTLDDAFIILDEAQNTTSEQMKMFLTRIGFGSQAVVTGDITQIDLPHSTRSGLAEAGRILQGIDEVGFITLAAEDVVRHPVVAKIIRAYDRYHAEEDSDEKARIGSPIPKTP